MLSPTFDIRLLLMKASFSATELSFCTESFTISMITLFVDKDGKTSQHFSQTYTPKHFKHLCSLLLHEWFKTGLYISYITVLSTDNIHERSQITPRFILTADTDILVASLTVLVSIRRSISDKFYLVLM